MVAVAWEHADASPGKTIWRFRARLNSQAQVIKLPGDFLRGSQRRGGAFQIASDPAPLDFLTHQSPRMQTTILHKVSCMVDVIVVGLGIFVNVYYPESLEIPYKAMKM